MNEEIKQKIHDVIEYCQERVSKQIEGTTFGLTYNPKIHMVSLLSDGRVEAILQPYNREEYPNNALIHIEGKPKRPVFVDLNEERDNT